MALINAVKGTYDILPDEIGLWHRVEKTVRDTMRLFAFTEIRTPIFEETTLFTRSIGEETDIVSKEMYTFRDMGDRNLTLRPEGTASVVRSFIEKSLDQNGLPQRLWYMGPMFRQERPQKGRQRQFHQFGVEVIGSQSMAVDAEVMRLFDVIAGKLGIENRMFRINCLGGSESRDSYRAALTAFLEKLEGRLCDDCKRRKVTNPLRVLDCKVPGCREVLKIENGLPKTVDYLSENDRIDFESVQLYMDALGLPFEADYSLVRGLDYYTGTVFEMNSDVLGSQSAIMGGGRYNGLIGQLGGQNLPAVGFACGMERLILILKHFEKDYSGKKAAQFFVALADGDSRAKALKIADSLRLKGFSVETECLDRSLKAQMKAASRISAKYVVIVYSDRSEITLRSMDVSEQRDISPEELMDVIENDRTLKKQTETIEIYEGYRVASEKN